jgi:hypothetical protein
LEEEEVGQERGIGGRVSGGGQVLIWLTLVSTIYLKTLEIMA